MGMVLLPPVVVYVIILCFMDNVKRTALHDLMVQMVDMIEMDPDPVERLALYLYLQDRSDTLARPMRNKAAYEAREKHTIDDIAASVGAAPTSVYDWMERWMKQSGAPRIRGRKRQPIDRFTDLRHVTVR